MADHCEAVLTNLRVLANEREASVERKSRSEISGRQDECTLAAC